METRKEIAINIIHARIGYILASLSSYQHLGINKEISKINNQIEDIKRSLIEDKEYLDIRDVIKMRNMVEEKKKEIKGYDGNPLYDGHKIACLLYEVSLEIEKLIIDLDISNEEFNEFLSLSSQYLSICARIVNKELLSY